MKKFISLLLALALLSGVALAETAEEVYAALGSWDIDVYESMTWKHSYENEEHPYLVSESIDAETGLIAWTFEAEAPEFNSSSLYQYPWLPQIGLAGELVADLDGDGEHEWLVLSTRPGTQPASWETLWLSVYEIEEDGVRLADEVRLSLNPLDMCADRMELFVMEHKGGEVIFFGGAFMVDSRWTQNYLLSYRGERLWADKALFTSRDETGAWLIHTFDGSDAQTALNCDPWDLPENAEAQSFEADQYDAFMSKAGLAAFDLGVYMQDPTASTLFDFTPAEGRAIPVFKLTCFAENDAGERTFRVLRNLIGEHYVPEMSVRSTGNINMRDKPSLSGTIIKIIEPDVTMEYLYEDSVDDRGVAWHKVRLGDTEGWVSSKFTVIE